MLSLCLEELVYKSKIPVIDVIQKLTVNPARLIGLSNRGSLKSGNFADVIIVDPDKTWIMSENIKSKSKNSPFPGMKLRGKAVCTIVGGKIVYSDI